MSSTLQQLERMRGDLSRLIEQAAQEAAASEADGPFRAGRQSMRSGVLALLSARAVELRAGNRHEAANAITMVALAVEEMR